MRVRPRLAGGLFLVASLVALTACTSTTTKSSSSGGAATSPPTPPSGGLAGTAWVLASYQGSSGSAVPAAPRATASLAFDRSNAVAGSTGCNSFSGTYTSTAQTLSIALGPMTQMACSSPLIQAQETAITVLLDQATDFQVIDDQLMLTGAHSAVLLTYGAGPVGLEGTSWNVTGVNNGNGGVETTAAAENLRATFGPSVAFTGFGGCNDLSGTYVTTGVAGVAITGLTLTKKTCAAGVDSLESQYIAALSRVSTSAIAGDMLTLRDPAGAAQVVLRHA